MAYYPKSQVKTNLYTNGNEYMLSTTKEEYKGYYYKTSTGKLYTGANPMISPSFPLEPIIPALDDVQENTSSPSLPSNTYIQKLATTIQTDPINPFTTNYNPGNTQNRIIPQSTTPIPTPEDKQRGFFIRYFCKKNNELIYFETTQADHDRIKSQDPTTAYDLYSVAALKWSISGDPSQVTSQNVTQINQTSAANGWLGFIQYFKGDFNKYLGS
jgi:hypothetical protein